MDPATRYTPMDKALHCWHLRKLCRKRMLYRWGSRVSRWLWRTRSHVILTTRVVQYTAGLEEAQEQQKLTSSLEPLTWVEQGILIIWQTPAFPGRLIRKEGPQETFSCGGLRVNSRPARTNSHTYNWTPGRAKCVESVDC